MFCTNCGNKLDDQQKFCVNCGQPVVDEDNNIIDYNNSQESINKDQIDYEKLEEDLRNSNLDTEVLKNNSLDTEILENKNFNNEGLKDNKAYLNEENNTYSHQERNNGAGKNKNIAIIVAIVIAIGILGAGAYVVNNKYGDKIMAMFNKSGEETLEDENSQVDEEDKQDNAEENEKQEDKKEEIVKEETEKEEPKWELDEDRLEKSPKLRNDYVMSTSDTELLTFAQLNDYTIDELFVARNEMLARHGYSFNNRENLKKYFQSKSWYNENPSFDGTMPTDIEKTNYDMISTIEFLKKAYEKSGDIQSNYVLEFSNKVVQSEERIRQLTDWELIIARNELFARYGLNFSTIEIKEHFLKKSWFIINDEVGNDLALTEIENKNLQLILAEEKKRMSIALDHDL